MEFRQLECFINVVEKRSFSKASKSMYMSQPAVTSNIRKLEEFFEVKLINRNNKGITITNEGKLLYFYANELIRLREKTINDVGSNTNKYESHINISSSTIPAQYIIPDIIKRFRDQYKNINFNVDITSSKQVALNILSGGINLGFVGSEYKNSQLEYVNLYEDELVMITSKNVYFNSHIINLDDIKNFNLILRNEGSGTRNILENSLQDIGNSLSYFKNKSEFNNNQSIKKMVELDCGIAFVSKLDIKNELNLDILNSYKIRELDLCRNFKFVYAKNRHFSPGEKKFLEFITNTARVKESIM